MGCNSGGCSCSTSSKSSSTGDKVAGCASNGCASGGCNRMNTFDWLTALDIEDQNLFDTVEISFKNGARKEFFKNPAHTRTSTGDMVLVEAENGGYDIGRVSLSGDLVRIQMKKRGVKEKTILQNVIRKANERDLERLQEAREAEQPSMVLARAISRSLSLDMKIGDVEFQGDKRKATFFYTADGRVDFRELIREFAKEFKVKIEMRQIGARQESARIGGLGPCGRELCCSTWLTDFKSVSTLAARYQNLAINQSKLSGQCGRLKCCLNFELDSYIEALEFFPTHADKIFTEEGSAVLMKTDIFRGIMYYCYEKDRGRGKFYPLEIEQVKEVLANNKKGIKPLDLNSLQLIDEDEDEDVGFDGDLTGVVELPNEQKKKKKRSNNNQDNGKTLGFARKDTNKNQDAPRKDERRGVRPDSDKLPNPPRGEGGKEPQNRQNRPQRNNANVDRNKEMSTRFAKSGTDPVAPQKENTPQQKDKNTTQNRENKNNQERQNNRPQRENRPENRPENRQNKPKEQHENSENPIVNNQQQRPKQQPNNNPNNPPREKMPNNRPDNRRENKVENKVENKGENIQEQKNIAPMNGDTPNQEGNQTERKNNNNRHFNKNRNNKNKPKPENPGPKTDG